VDDPVGFVVEKVAPVQGFIFLRVQQFFSVSIIPQVLRTHLPLHVISGGRMNETYERYKTNNGLSDIGELWIESYFCFSLL
jgi:hypothetical protein